MMLTAASGRCSRGEFESEQVRQLVTTQERYRYSLTHSGLQANYLVAFAESVPSLRRLAMVLKHQTKVWKNTPRVL